MSETWPTSWAQVIELRKVKDTIEVPCPQCGGKAGEDCMTMYQIPLPKGRFHQARHTSQIAYALGYLRGKAEKEYG